MQVIFSPVVCAYTDSNKYTQTYIVLQLCQKTMTYSDINCNHKFSRHGCLTRFFKLQFLMSQLFYANFEVQNVVLLPGPACAVYLYLWDCVISDYVVSLSITHVFIVWNWMYQVKSEWEKGKFQLKAGDEDIHTANERRLKVNGLWFCISQ